MSYTKQTWQTGDTITAEKLNHIEDGVDDVSRQLSDLAGGTTGQFLVKASDTDYDFGWVTVPNANGVNF